MFSEQRESPDTNSLTTRVQLPLWLPPLLDRLTLLLRNSRPCFMSYLTRCSVLCYTSYALAFFSCPFCLTPLSPPPLSLSLSLSPIMDLSTVKSFKSRAFKLSQSLSHSFFLQFHVSLNCSTADEEHSVFVQKLHYYIFFVSSLRLTTLACGPDDANSLS